MKKCKRCNGFGKLYFKPKGYTCGGHYSDCPKCNGLGLVRNHGKEKVTT